MRLPVSVPTLTSARTATRLARLSTPRFVAPSFKRSRTVPFAGTVNDARAKCRMRLRWPGRGAFLATVLMTIVPFARAGARKVIRKKPLASVRIVFLIGVRSSLPGGRGGGGGGGGGAAEVAAAVAV